jgi:peptidoglycan/xylan/chitin deacetylase (PgdA/CDA1 family)
VILAWHRFTAEPSRPDRFPVAVLRQQLEMLRRDRHEVLALPSLIEKLADPGADLSRAVVFTVDDGYHDFADLAAEVFLAYDCPVTTFLTTGFLDGRSWMWWDQVEYCLAHAGRPELTTEVGGEVLQLDLTESARAGSLLRLWAALKQVSTADRCRLTEELAARLDLTIPVAPPADCRPMLWGEVRTLSSRGLCFAPHTVTHPVLSRSPDSEAQAEIEESWRRVAQEVPGSEAVFAYPNGVPCDFNSAHIARLEQLGFLGAVTTVAGYASSASARYALPRFPATTETGVLQQVLSGAERAVRIVRAWRS